MKNLLLLFIALSVTGFAFSQGQDLVFDGVDEQVQVPDDNTLDFGLGDWSLEAWVKKNANDGGHITSKRGAGLGPGFQSFTDGSGAYGASILSSGSTSTATGTSSVNGGDWYHVAATFDRDGNLTVYVDGKIDGSTNISSFSSVEISNSHMMGIGARGDNFGFSNANLDEVRVWNDLRTTAEIRQSMHTELSGSEGNLAAYYSFNNMTTANGTPGEAQDESANTNNGTCSNMENGDIGTSTAPVGSSVTVSSAIAHQNSSASIGDITFDDTPDPFDASQDVYVSKINNSPNATTGISESNVTAYYYVINPFENGGAAGTFNVSLTFPSPTANGNSVTLYSRANGSTGTWSSEGSATASGGNVTFTGITGFSQFIMATNSVLPIDMVYFKGRITENGNVLSWQTASEQNNLGFEIQRSATGQPWEKIGFEEGNDSVSEENNYTFTDTKPIPGINYYRLKQIDRDGNFEYSGVVSVELKASHQKFYIYPNPVQNGELTLLLDYPEFEAATLGIYDSLGRLVRTERFSPNHMSLNVNDLTNGIYLFSVKMNGQEFSKRVIIR